MSDELKNLEVKLPTIEEEPTNEGPIMMRRCNNCRESKDKNNFETKTLMNGQQKTYKTCKECREQLSFLRPDKVICKYSNKKFSQERYKKYLDSKQYKLNIIRHTLNINPKKLHEYLIDNYTSEQELLNVLDKIIIRRE